VAHVDRHRDGEGARPHPDAVIAQLAGGQAGRVGRWQLLRQGVTRDEIDRRLRSGHLHLLRRGVYAAGHRGGGPRCEYFAAWLALGPDAVVSHFAAAAEHDLRRDSASAVDVTVRRRARTRPGIRVHQSILAPEDRVVVGGLPVTSWPRTVLDLAALLRQTEITRMLERADKLGLFDGRALDAICARASGHRGTGALRLAREAIDPRHGATRSGWERDVLPMLDAMGLPRPQVNRRIGPYEFDLVFERHGVVVELDSWEHHRDRTAFEIDRERDRWLAMRGILAMRFRCRLERSRTSSTSSGSGGPHVDRRRDGRRTRPPVARAQGVRRVSAR
jgi:hypothetical protein